MQHLCNLFTNLHWSHCHFTKLDFNWKSKALSNFAVQICKQTEKWKEFLKSFYSHYFMNKFPKRNDMTVNKKQKNRWSNQDFGQKVICHAKYANFWTKKRPRRLTVHATGRRAALYSDGGSLSTQQTQLPFLVVEHGEDYTTIAPSREGWPKIYIPSTINNWRKLLRTAIWSDENGLVSGS